LLDAGRSPCDLDRGCLQREGLRLGDFACVGVLHLLGFTILSGRLWVIVLRVVCGWSPAARAWGERSKAGSVGCRLGAELSKVDVGTSLVTHGHRFAELALGPEAVEDDGVDDDAERFDNDFDDTADKRPVLRCTLEKDLCRAIDSAYLKSAHEVVRHVVLK
jgi:hypothetical protein